LERSVESLPEHRIRRRNDAVVNPLPVPSIGDQSGFSKVCEMPRDRGLGLVEHLDKEADADLAIGHEVQEA